MEVLAGSGHSEQLMTLVDHSLCVVLVISHAFPRALVLSYVMMFGRGI